MYGLELKPGKVSWIEPSPELCVRLSNAVLVKSPKNPRARVVLELCEHLEPAEEDDDEKESPRVAIAVLTKENDNVPLSIFINTGMGLRLSTKGCSGAIVHVTGTKFTPEDELSYEDGPLSLPQYLTMQQPENGLVFDDEEDEDSDESDDMKDIEEKISRAILSKRKNNERKQVTGNRKEENKLETKNNCNKVQFKEETEIVTNKQKEETKKSKQQQQTNDKKSEKRKLSPTSIDDQSNIKKTKRPPLSLQRHPSGLQFQDTIIGVGNKAKQGHSVALQYTLRLENGTIVDKADRRRPFKFRLGIGECIKGFDIGVKGMREGGERHLIVPPEIGYGDQRLPSIPPNSTLFFDVAMIRAW